MSQLTIMSYINHYTLKLLYIVPVGSGWVGDKKFTLPLITMTTRDLIQTS